MSTIKISDIAVGDIMAEKSFYRVVDRNATSVKFTHIKTGATVQLDNKYVEDLLTTADQYGTKEVVGKDDKFWTAKQVEDGVKKGLFKDGEHKDGDLKQLGIRSLWDSIDGSEVFTVVFKKTDKPYTLKKFKELKAKQISDALAEIEATKTAKKGVADKAAEVLKNIQDNPILPYEPGEARKLRGRKKDFRSITGFYDVYDLDITESEEASIRKINVNTIISLTVRGIEYTVE